MSCDEIRISGYVGVDGYINSLRHFKKNAIIFYVIMVNCWIHALTCGAVFFV
jgi:hypothetical protein